MEITRAPRAPSVKLYDVPPKPANMVGYVCAQKKYPHTPHGICDGRWWRRVDLPPEERPIQWTG